MRNELQIVKISVLKIVVLFVPVMLTILRQNKSKHSVNIFQILENFKGKNHSFSNKKKTIGTERNLYICWTSLIGHTKLISSLTYYLTDITMGVN